MALSGGQQLFAQGNEQSLTKEQIFNALAEREKRVTTAEFEWEQQETYFFEHPQAAMRKIKPSNTPRIQKYRVTVHLDGQKTAIHMEAIGDPSGFELAENTEAFNGDELRVLTVNPNDAKNGSIANSRRANRTFDSMTFKPIQLSLRSLNPSDPQILPAECDLANDRATIGSSEVVMLVAKESQGPLRRSLWLDPAREFIPLRWVSRRPDGTDSITLEISYMEADGKNWVPNKWKGLGFDLTGKLAISVEAEMKHYVLGKSVSAEKFTIEFPDGTRVIDEIQNRKFTVGESEVLPRSQLAWLVGVNLAVVAIIVAIYFAIKVKKRRRKV